MEEDTGRGWWTYGREVNGIVNTVDHKKEEAARAGYRQGWDDEYEAARLTVELVVDAWRKDPAGFDVESALKALDMSREKAREMLARDKFTVRCIPSTEPGQKWFG